MKQRIKISLMILVTCVACTYESIGPDFEGGSYFPHTAGSRWKYELRANCDWPMQDEMCVSTTWAAAGPEIYGEDYSPFFDLYLPMASPTTTMQFVKVVDHEYFASGYYMGETKFLVDNLELNSTWRGSDYYQERSFTITEVDAIKTVRGKSYPHVIVVTEIQFNPGHEPRFDMKTTRVHYYARGVGEIYMKQTWEYDGRVETREYKLVEYYIAPEK